MKLEAVFIDCAVEVGEKNWQETRTGPVYALTIEVPHEFSVTSDAKLLKYGLDPAVHDVHRQGPESGAKARETLEDERLDNVSHYPLNNLGRNRGGHQENRVDC
jgi:hypothetical protein